MGKAKQLYYWVDDLARNLYCAKMLLWLVSYPLCLYSWFVTCCLNQ